MDNAFEVSFQHQTCQRRTAKLSPLPVFLIVRKAFRISVLGVQSGVSSSVGERGRRCSAVTCGNWCHTKCCCFIGWCHVGQQKRTRKKERAEGMIGRSRNLQPDSPLESFQLVMQFHFGGKC